MHSANIKMQKTGFSLVELSIVLVILGLLIGGVLSGQSLIRAAELRSITTEHSRIVTAAQSFRDKYFALPGDMANAQSFWGIAHATPATCVTTTTADIRTCNGDGNGNISVSAGSNESFRIWQHMANAGLIEGTYSGVPSAATIYSTSLVNAPHGRLGSSLWFVFNWGVPISGEPVWFDGTYGNRLSMGDFATNAEPSTPNLTPAEAWNIDSKIDDGKPAQGKFWAQWPTCTNAANSAATTADYSLTLSSKACFAMFPNAI